jgi:hypothetical protein
MVECLLHKKLDRLRKEMVMSHFLDAISAFAGVVSGWTAEV